MFLIYDTETTGLPKNYKAPLDDFDNWPRLVQLAWQIHDKNGELLSVKNFIVKPEGFEIPLAASKVHGITTDYANEAGEPLSFVLEEFNKVLQEVIVVVGHNIEFDNNIMGSEFLRIGMETNLFEVNSVDTKDTSTNFCAIPSSKGKGFKWPRLDELHEKLFHESFDAAHNASADVQATARCFLELVRIGIIKVSHLKTTPEIVKDFIEHNKKPFQSIGLEVEPYHQPIGEQHLQDEINAEHVEKLKDAAFTHLHVHTQYSVLDGLSNIEKLTQKAKNDGMKAMAITDHGIMYGVKHFHEAMTYAGLKPILGCEVYVARRGMAQKKTKEDNSGWHLILLAKNEAGYKNLMKLISAGSIDGFYYKPRIDKELLRKYSEGLIALTACLGGEVPKLFMEAGKEKAEAALLEYKEIFGEDFYLELQRHPTGEPDVDRKVFDDQVLVNQFLIDSGKKHGLKIVATNDVHFIEKDDASAHDRLICIKKGEDLNDPRRFRYTRQEWFKTQQEMKELFADVPEAIINTQEVVDKIETYELNHKPIMPEFTIPEEFEDANAYLRHITYEGATYRYGEVSKDLVERIDFELETISNMGFPDYFLIVWDILKAAREMGVWVGPGRGSAAGSVVSYCLRITDIEPLKYNLLFERFLNPDRISMPDIDIDFDDEGRNKLLKWVSEKYGKMRVAHLITFGTMAAKMAIRDVSRVQKLPLHEADRLAKMVPDRPGVSLNQALKEVTDFRKELEEGKPEVSSVIENAKALEGSIRNIGTHACGIIIGREDLDKYVPLISVKDSELDISTQFDGKFIESIGLLKMDFLGLKTLSIIKDTLENVKRSEGIEIDIEKIPFDDKKTYDLFSRGDTVALFQFESDGMRKHLKNLKPSRFEDLIAMVSLFRPGPMEYIPEFIERKQGIKKIEYDLPIMEEILKETYGITVYQEQVMLLSRKMAGFSRGQSDSLRKAMGKKKVKEMEKLHLEFLEGCRKNGLPDDKVAKVWKDWLEFAKYAFNKSHATCYAHLAYQTGYLKAHHPAEFMAANLSHNLNDIKKITQLISEANHLDIEVMRPDVNESASNFTVTKEGVIRFGLAAIKGVGGSAVEQIITVREADGLFNSIFDFAKRVNLRMVNKRSFEALAMAGAFDGFSDAHRAQFFYQEKENSTPFIETVIRHGSIFQEKQNSAQTSLFGDQGDAFDVLDPVLPKCEPWSLIHMLKLEKEVTGFYISGHPLDEYKATIEEYCKHEINDLNNDLASFNESTVWFAGLITESLQKTSKKGDPYGSFTVEDFSGSIRLMLFKEDYLKRKHLLDEGSKILIKAKVEERYNQKDNFEVRISEMYLLSEAMNKLAKSITLRMSADDLDEALVSGLIDMVREHSGVCPIKFHIDDPDDGLPLLMKSSTFKVEPRSFLIETQKLKQLKYSLK